MIRAVGPADLWALRQAPLRQQTLYTEQVLAEHHRPFWFALRSMLGEQRADRVTWISHDVDGMAVLQARGRAGRREQDVIYLASSRPHERHISDYERWFQLLERWTATAAAAQIERLYAALPQRHDELREIFRQAGFHVYTQQLILQWSAADGNHGTAPVAMRPQARRDPWAMQRLYGVVTPKPVQMIEARTAGSWAGAAAGLRQRSWVLERGDALAAILQVRSGRAGHAVTLLIHPDERAQTADILRYGLAQIGMTRPIFLLLRSYQHDLLEGAEQLGFHLLGEQDVVVRTTAQTIRRPVFAPVLEHTLRARLHLQR